MGDILSKIQDDINEYESLCRKYEEEVVYSQTRWGDKCQDCYGKHAMKLQERKRKEMSEGTWTGWK